MRRKESTDDAERSCKELLKRTVKSFKRLEPRHSQHGVEIGESYLVGGVAISFGLTITTSEYNYYSMPTFSHTISKMLFTSYG